MEQGKETFLKLVRLGIWQQIDSVPETIDWAKMKALAEHQSLTGVVLDGIETLQQQGDGVLLPEKRFLVQWIGEVLQQENNYLVQQEAAAEMALLFHGSNIRTYVLKGQVVSECYPRPEHRPSVDMDCFLLPTNSDFNAWALGNDIVKENGYEVTYDFYKNSTFFFPGLTVENHLFLTPFRGNKQLKRLEITLQSMLKNDSRVGSGAEERIFDSTYLYRPPVMVSALFLIEHAYSHFLHEGLTWRLVLDWIMFGKMHKDEIDWYSLDALIDEFGFRKFYDAYYKLGRYLLGEIFEESLSKNDMRMMEDIWAPLDLHGTVKGFRGKLALVGNTWRARWKYRYFTDISMLHALWIQAKGVLFIKNPKFS